MAQATAALWLLSLLLMGSSLARALGVTLWMDLLLGVILVGTALQRRRCAAGTDSGRAFDPAAIVGAALPACPAMPVCA